MVAGMTKWPVFPHLLRFLFALWKENKRKKEQRWIVNAIYSPISFWVKNSLNSGALGALEPWSPTN